MWEAHRTHFGKDGDPVLVWQTDTRTMNPSVPDHVITAAFDADPTAARSKYGAQFRADLEEYVSVDVVDRVVMLGRRDVPPQGHARYCAFCDPAGGSGADAMALGIAHREGDKAVPDVVAAVTPPFSLEDVVEQFSALLARYGLRRVVGDKYGGAWPAEQFRKRGVTYEPAEATKSVTYTTFLPLPELRFD
jgi:hypothetical protein